MTNELIEQFLIEHHEDNTVSMLSVQLGLSPYKVSAILKKLGKKAAQAKDIKEKYITEYHGKFSRMELAEKLECPVESIDGILARLGLKARAMSREEINERRMKRNISNENRPPAVYNQSGSPYGIADELKGIKRV